MAKVSIRVAEFLVPFYETALRELGGTDIDKPLNLDNEGTVVLSADIPGAPGDARTMEADLTLTADRPAHIRSATYYDGGGMELATLTYS
ncbi:hypothetical protein ACFYWD_20850 [Streptomyces sp. NPDC003781]|uniref:hypothetical protein n=1 Tax=Streptomyces sp. NPDC003781 TaxID=3364686 RepID=UPI0036D04DF6